MKAPIFFQAVLAIEAVLEIRYGFEVKDNYSILRKIFTRKLTHPFSNQWHQSYLSDRIIQTDFLPYSKMSLK